MARITVEDCAEVVENRFELVVLAAHRAKIITSGSPIMVEKENDKNAVIALREIADRKVNTDSLRESVIQNMQKTIQRDSLEEVEGSDLASEVETEMMELDMVDESDFDATVSDNDEGLDFDDENLDVED